MTDETRDPVEALLARVRETVSKAYDLTDHSPEIATQEANDCLAVAWAAIPHLERRMEELTRERDEAEARADRLHEDRKALLNVKSTDGLTCSEWYMRTATAERERDAARAEVEELERTGWWAKYIAARAEADALRNRIEMECRELKSEPGRPISLAQRRGREESADRILALLTPTQPDSTEVDDGE